MNPHESILCLQRALAAASSAKTRDWWQKYLRGAIVFRGIGIPTIRAILADWRTTAGVADLPVR